MQRVTFRNFSAFASLGYLTAETQSVAKMFLNFLFEVPFAPLRFDFLTAEVQRVAKLFFDLFLFEVLLLRLRKCFINQSYNFE